MKTILLISLIIFPFAIFSQITSETNRYVGNFKIPTMKERYKIDYELVNEELIANDSLILESIPIDFPDNHRKDSEDIIVFDPTGAFQILIYSKDRTTNNKN